MWSSESDLDDDEGDEVEDEYWQEEESSEDTEESVNHVELGMRLSPTKNPAKQKKWYVFYFTLHICIQVLWSIISHYCFIIYLS